MKYRIKVYPITVMSEVEVEANSEGEAIVKAEKIAMSGGCKFYTPDRRIIGLIYKEAPKARLRAGKAAPKKDPEGSTLDLKTDDRDHSESGGASE